MLCTVDLTSYLYKAELLVPSNSLSEAEALTAKTRHHFLGLHPMSHGGPQTRSGNTHLNRLPGSSYERVKPPAPKWAMGVTKESLQPSASKCCTSTDLSLCYKKKKINRKKWDLWEDYSTRKKQQCLKAWWKTSLKMNFHRELNKILESDTRYKRWQTSSLWDDGEQK